MFATDLMAFLLVSVLWNFPYLAYNLKNANPFTFVGYLFICFLSTAVFRSPRPLFSVLSDVGAPLSPLWANGNGLRALILGLEYTSCQLSPTWSPRLSTLTGMASCPYQEFHPINVVFEDEQSISALARLLPGSYRTLLFAELCQQASALHAWSPRGITSTPVPQFLVLGNVMDQQ